MFKNKRPRQAQRGTVRVLGTCRSSLCWSRGCCACNRCQSLSGFGCSISTSSQSFMSWGGVLYMSFRFQKHKKRTSSSGASFGIMDIPVVDCKVTFLLAHDQISFRFHPFPDFICQKLGSFGFPNLEDRISNIEYQISSKYLMSNSKIFKETILQSLKWVEKLSPATCPRWNSARHRLLKWLAAGEGKGVAVWHNETPEKTDHATKNEIQ